LVLWAVERLGGVQATAARLQDVYQRLQAMNSVDELSSMVSSLASLSGGGGSGPPRAPTAPAESYQVKWNERQQATAGVAEEAASGTGGREAAEVERAALHVAHATSFYCEFCGGVVAFSRRDAHMEQWCPVRHPS